MSAAWSLPAARGGAAAAATGGRPAPATVALLDEAVYRARSTAAPTGSSRERLASAFTALELDFFRRAVDLYPAGSVPDDFELELL